MQIAWSGLRVQFPEVTRCSHALSGSFASKEVGTLSYTVGSGSGDADTRYEEGLSSGGASTSGGRRMWECGAIPSV